MTRHIITKATVGSLLLALVVGCSSDPEDRNNNGNDGGSNATATADEIVDGLVDAYCDAAMRCGDIPVGNKETCEAFLTNMGDQGRESLHAMRESFEAGKATATKESLKACFDALRALDCDEGFEGDFRGIPGCADAFTGTVADGQPCLTDLACSSANSRCFEAQESEDECAATCEPLGTRCRRDADCTDGKVCEEGLCETPATAPAGEGEDCSGGQRCEAGLSCIPAVDGENYTYTCGQLNGEGGNCDQNGRCQAGLVCNDDSWPGVCETPAPRIAEGQPCELGEDSECATGLVCVPANNFQSATCEKPKTKGESCTKVLECGGFFSLFICDATTQKCVDRPKTGPCPLAQFGEGCHLFDAYCDVSDEQNPTCRAHKAAGATCSSDSECGGPTSNSWCDRPGDSETGTCAAGESTVCTL